MNFSFCAGAIVEDKLYFSDNYCNAFLSITLKTGELSYLGNFPEEKPIVFNLHKTCINYGNNLIFLPNMGSHIHIYELITGHFKTVKVKRTSNTRFLFCDGFIHKNKLWIFPANLQQPILKYDLTSWECEELGALGGLVGSVKGLQDQCFWKMCHDEEIAVLAVLGTSLVVVYDLDKHEPKVIDTGINKLNSIHITKSGFVLCTIDMHVYEWNNIDNKTKEILIIHDNFASGAHIIVESDNNTYLVPDYGQEILLRYETGFVPKAELTLKNSKMNMKIIHFENWALWENKIVLFPNFGGDVIYINDNSIESLKTVDNCVSEYREKYLAAILEKSKGKLLSEGLDYSYSDYIDALIKDDKKE